MSTDAHTGDDDRRATNPRVVLDHHRRHSLRPSGRDCVEIGVVDGRQIAEDHMIAYNSGLGRVHVHALVDEHSIAEL